MFPDYVLFAIGSMGIGAFCRIVVPDQPRSMIATVVLITGLILMIQPAFFN